MHLRVTVGTDHIEGIARLIGKICFLEKNQHERKKSRMKDSVVGNKIIVFIIMTILIHKLETK